jgi:hypothetical protein
MGDFTNENMQVSKESFKRDGHHAIHILSYSDVMP